MKKQVLFCVETNKKSDTDWVYINETIKHYYQNRNDVSKKPVYMGGKNKYQTSAVLRDIDNRKRAFKGTTEVVFCIDTDKKDVDPEQHKYFDDVTRYCAEHGYKLIWFNRDIEEVYWGKHISSTDKIKEAARYRAQKKIEESKPEKLRKKTCTRYNSNILDVLDTVLLC